MGNNTTQPPPGYYDVVTEYRALIYKVCHLFCAMPEDVKDLFQEIVLNIGISLPSFKGQCKVSTWVYRVAINTAITHRKKQQRRHSPLDEAAFEQVAQEMSATQTEEYKMMMQQIAALPAVEKAIVLLYLDNLSYQDISQVTGITVSNVGVKINRIKEKLRKQLNNRP